MFGQFFIPFINFIRFSFKNININNVLFQLINIFLNFFFFVFFLQEYFFFVGHLSSRAISWMLCAQSWMQVVNPASLRSSLLLGSDI